MMTPEYVAAAIAALSGVPVTEAAHHRCGNALQ
jgi:hypothetical protein